MSAATATKKRVKSKATGSKPRLPLPGGANHDTPLDHPELYTHTEPHPDFDGVFTMLIDEEPTLVDEHGNRCKLDEAGDPIYDDGGNLKVTKRRGGTKAKGSGSRKLRVNSNNLLKDRLPVGGFMPYTRVMDSVGNWSRLMSWGPIGVTEERETKREPLVAYLDKLKSTDKSKVQDFLQAHQTLEHRTRPTEELAFTFFLTNTQDGWIPTIGFHSIHKGITLKSALKALGE